MLKKIIINNYLYEYEVRGQGQPFWLFLHGFMGSHADFANIKPQGTCIYLNLLGFGQKQPIIAKTRMTIQSQVQDLAQILTELAIDKVNLVGYSMGGRLAIAFTLTYPTMIEQLFLESTTAGIGSAIKRQARQISDQQKAQQIRKLGLENFVTNWEQLPLFATQTMLTTEQRIFMHQQRISHNKLNVANSLEMMGTGQQPNYWPKLANLQVKTVIIVGAFDQKFTTIGKQMAELLPNSQLVVMQGAGHNVHFEQPNAYSEVLARSEN
ncbi:2-succinyl-6-hydroxy-2,4-cyclohexadiene-1-carboxylate synthase [Weissella beninensis]|uniref:Putative 2-succinyl-6-hydroxy-2,4-cyclohexadiene-1-carboxylate synthase n=1 Tax=Periweissella beninensis TaxID=504936 RepID=A0ABT0VHZ8_9LACO|nr:2-succinyl-6-hydroxy-2,4-cyclohexadiene-1-carboxylate synthase [Periweissella beninensis]MBM7543425.1 2-succinyl-6-hydroxy-2,4-cyclohexadiene-1-carboxylate synthase [Periweissella beninensis]MCM2437281.1 2-succinyl-6-hydroxy-2,4-cyclohexadiene-1-carboxylate synthase [Periweissella beninensis]